MLPVPFRRRHCRHRQSPKTFGFGHNAACTGESAPAKSGIGITNCPVSDLGRCRCGCGAEAFQFDVGALGDMGGMSPRSTAGRELQRRAGRGFQISNRSGSSLWRAVGGSYLLREFPVPLLCESATAALMPAYRVPLPQEVYKCLLENPDGCPYDQMARFFRQQAARVIETAILSGRVPARRHRNGNPWRRRYTSTPTRSTSHWGTRRRISSRRPWASRKT